MCYEPPGWLAKAVGAFGRAAREQLATGAGEPEEALRGPLVALVTEIGSRHGLRVVPVGEAMLSDLQVRPDYAVQVDGAICGYIEIKKPGLGADAPALTGRHNRRQWQRLSNLPNLIYTDGTRWARYETGVRKGEILTLDGGLTGDLRVTSPDFEQLLVTFLGWAPTPIRNVDALVRAVAPACRLLRDEVADQLTRERLLAGTGPKPDKQLFSGLAADWRRLLFPTADDGEFADGYAQTVTFGLLYARSRGITFEGRGYHEIGDLIAMGNTLMGRALQVLTDQFGGSPEQAGPFKVTLDTLLRVVGAVDWDRVRSGRRDTYLYLYEHFLAEYDPVKRQESGVYYTPVELVKPMVRLTDDALRTRLGLVRGLGTDDVRVVDPAAGTGTFLLRILDTVFERVARCDGTGEAREVISAMAGRLVGFELQMGPYAVSELRLTDLLAHRGVELAAADRMPLHVTNTLDDPFRTQPPLASFLKAISDSTRRADQIKAVLPVTVVIGNPPYRERANGHGSWVELGRFYGSRGRAEDPSLMSDFRLPGNGRNEYKLKNMAWYFWRWATWKVFDSPGGQGRGVVTFVTTAAYLRGTAFKGMRKYLRRTCDEGWIIDLSPEGMRPDVATRIFPRVQHPLAVGIFVRAEDDTDEPARIHYTAVHGKRAEKFTTLGALGLDDPAWQDVRDGWDAPFTPAGEASWDEHPALDDLFPVRVPGVKANRAWVYSARPEMLRQRWRRLLTEPDPVVQAELLKGTDARTMNSQHTALPEGDRLPTLAEESDLDPPLRRVLHRSFDRKWLLADARVIDRPRRELWRAATSANQMFLVEQHSQVISTGPGIIVSSLLPDQHCFDNRGGRVLPVFHPDGQPTSGSSLLNVLSKRLGIQVSGLDLLCYVAAVASHPGYTARFAEQLETPGVRVPLTADAEIFTRAVQLGREVVWASTYGQRCADPAAGRPPGDVSLPPGHRPMSLDGIPHTPEGIPATIEHTSDHPDADSDDVLIVGASRFRPVPAAVWRYDVGGKPVLRQWFGYRKREPGGRVTSPLDLIVADRWTHEDTVELRELLCVLRRLTDLAPAQADLLDQVCAGPLITVDELTSARVLPVPDSRRVLSAGGAGEGQLSYRS